MTLAVMSIARGGALLITNGTPVSGMDNAFNWILLNKTCFGRHIYAVGGNEKAAIASGINSGHTGRRFVLRV